MLVVQAASADDPARRLTLDKLLALPEPAQRFACLAERGQHPGGAGDRGAEQPDGSLAMHARHDDQLVQELVLLGSRGVLVSLPLHGGVLPQARSRHGALLVGIGDRDF